MYQLGFGIIDNFMNFGGFPIKGLTNQEWGTEYYPLSSLTRDILSVLWYAFLVALPASLPLCIAKHFKSITFYKKYKVIWLVCGMIFTVLTSILIGLVPVRDSEMFNYGFYGYSIEVFLLIDYAIFYLVTVCLAVIPAYIQYKYYNRS
ncbi:hypothetical protein [Methyloglobulus sp.]|uniref:hypothetical protein n=1 Tax=Methyloglobulus sp. TaxID=2518622 RepID=UPI0032B83503